MEGVPKRIVCPEFRPHFVCFSVSCFREVPPLVTAEDDELSLIKPSLSRENRGSMLVVDLTSLSVDRLSGVMQPPRMTWGTDHPSEGVNG